MRIAKFLIQEARPKGSGHRPARLNIHASRVSVAALTLAFAAATLTQVNQHPDTATAEAPTVRTTVDRDPVVSRSGHRLTDPIAASTSSSTPTAPPTQSVIDQADLEGLADERAAALTRLNEQAAQHAQKLARQQARQARIARKKAAARAKARAAETAAANVSPGTLQAKARKWMIDYGFPADQWNSLNLLVTRESGWNPLAQNASSGAYGLPQSLPGAKMATVGIDWRTNPHTQMVWMFGYIKARYGNPDGAWAHSQSHGWY